MGKETSCSLTAHSTRKCRVIVLRFRSSISSVLCAMVECRGVFFAVLSRFFHVLLGIILPQFCLFFSFFLQIWKCYIWKLYSWLWMNNLNAGFRLCHIVKVLDRASLLRIFCVLLV